MPYTLWHQGILIGESDFEGENPENAPRIRPRRHLAGVFRPTAHGRHLLPRMCGILTAGFELKQELLRRGVDADTAPPALIEQLFETTSAGAHILDIGRVLSDVELRDPKGTTLPFNSIGFMDLAELARLSKRLEINDTVDFDEVPPKTAEFIVSVTLREPAPYRIRTMLLQ